MAVTYGFYDSISGDRVYNAAQMSQIFEGLISDGVYETVGNGLVVSVGTGMGISVGTGRAWFNNTWTKNDAALPLTVTAAHATLDRIDCVILEVDESTGVRANSIKMLDGTPAGTPVPPTLQNTATLHQYALAEIAVDAAVTEILAGDITNKIGTVNTPFVTGIVDLIDAATYWAQLEADFEAWFDTIKGQLSTEAEGNLQLQIDVITDVTLDTATGTYVLDDTDDEVILLDPGGADRIVQLPDEAVANHNFSITNMADADGEDLTIKDYALTSILGVLGRGETGVFVSDKTTYREISVARKTLANYRPIPLAVGDTFMRIPVPSYMSNPDAPWYIVGVEATVDVAGTTNNHTIQLNNGSNDILHATTYPLYIETGEYRSIDAANQPVILAAYRSLSGVSFIDVDIDGVCTTPGENLTVMIHCGRM